MCYNYNVLLVKGHQSGVESLDIAVGAITLHSILFVLRTLHFQTRAEFQHTHTHTLHLVTSPHAHVSSTPTYHAAMTHIHFSHTHTHTHTLHLVTSPHAHVSSTPTYHAAMTHIHFTHTHTHTQSEQSVNYSSCYHTQFTLWWLSVCPEKELIFTTPQFTTSLDMSLHCFQHTPCCQLNHWLMGISHKPRTTAQELW